MKIKRFISIIVLFIIISASFATINTVGQGPVSNEPTVVILASPYSMIYEGDMINCEMTGNPTEMFWTINDQSKHYTFHNNNPLIFDPEPTPLEDEFVLLTVHVKNDYGEANDSIFVKINRIYFGDIHWHTKYSDGKNTLDKMFTNAIGDNYLDFAACTDHAESIDTPLSQLIYGVDEFKFLTFIKNKLFRISEWEKIKEKTQQYYKPGNFSTILGFEYSACEYYPGGWKISPNGHEDVSHVNFYYRDVYADAPEYGACDKFNYDDIFSAMAEQFDKGNMNFGFPHHPLGKIKFGKNKWASFTVNFTFLARGMEKTDERNKVLRGVEAHSVWGQAFGKYSDIPIYWPYVYRFDDRVDSWVENSMWEWSDNHITDCIFSMVGGSDHHHPDRPAGAQNKDEKPAGITCVYSVHNKREEIWDAMYDGQMYGSQLLKIRANVKVNDQMAYGKWLDVEGPAKIQISAMSTFNGKDSSGKNQNAFGYDNNSLENNISDIWIVKKDTSRQRPWCKIVAHYQPDSHYAFVEFEDFDVQPKDFYYVLIHQKGEARECAGETVDDYLAYLGPIFINSVS